MILLALQAAQAIQALAMNAYVHGNVSPYNIAYQDGQGVLIDLPTLRPIQGTHKPLQHMREVWRFKNLYFVVPFLAARARCHM